MTTGRWMDQNHVVHVGPSGQIASFADITAGNPTTDVVNMKLYDKATFIIIYGAGGTGTSTITVEACSTALAGATQAVPFTYWICTTPDTWGEATQATLTGFLTAAAANKCYVIEVNSSELYSTYNFVRLQFTEVDSTAVDGAVVCILSGARYDRGIPLTALA